MSSRVRVAQGEDCAVDRRVLIGAALYFDVAISSLTNDDAVT